MEEGVLKDCEVKLKHRDGTISEASMTANMIYDQEGRPVGTEGVLRDITERKRVDNLT
ncbi:hypothetical protein ES705_09344 [subsurface metagenome]